MDPITGLITGGAALLGSLFSSNSSAQQNQANIQMQKETNQMNIVENQKNRDFQQQMSSTAYQRASTDMQAAGLNPMMMFGSGSAASSPAGGTPNIQAPRGDPHAGMAQMGDAIGKAVSSAVAAKTFDKMTQEISNLQTQQALTSAVTRTEEERPASIRAQVATEKERAKYTRATTATEKERPENVKASTFNVLTNTARESNRMPVYRLEGATAEDILSMPDWLRRSMNIANKASDTVAPLLSSAHKAKSLFTDRFHY